MGTRSLQSPVQTATIRLMVNSILRLPCRCGCGHLATFVDAKGCERLGFVWGHNRRAIPNPLRKPRAACFVCGAPCHRPINRFCSLSCKTTYRNRQTSTERPFECQQCHKTFIVPGYVWRQTPSRFCSMACYNLKRKVGLVACLNCGVGFTPRRSRAGPAKYCSQRCMGLAWRASGHPNWRGGKHYMYLFREVMAPLVRHEANNSCELCGHKRRGRKLQVHHIDEDKDNNGRANLIALCVPCHRKAHSLAPLLL